MSTGEDELRSLVGESIHTALRKAGDTPEAHAAWQAIGKIPTEDWRTIIAWHVWALRESGVTIERVPA